MALLNELNNGDCGCDNNFYSVINESPLLSGTQENSFNKSLEESSVINNAMANNIKNLNNNTQNNISANSNNNMNNNLDLNQLMNNQPSNNQINEQNIQNILNSIPDTSKRNPPLPDRGSLRMNQEQMEMNNQILQNLNNLNSPPANTESNHKFIATHFNYVLVVLVALAVNDLAKYFINRSIKFQNGTHNYYIYYTLGLVLVLYMVSKYVNRL
jgi:hypothetical protein